MSKALRVVPVPASSLVTIEFEGGGEVPDALKGNFTSVATARARIREWLARHPHRDPDDPQPRGPGRPRRQET